MTRRYRVTVTYDVETKVDFETGARPVDIVKDPVFTPPGTEIVDIVELTVEGLDA